VSKQAYEKLYSGDAYRIFSPGEQRVQEFLKLAKLTQDNSVIDIGCGTGRATAQIGQHCKVYGMDWVNAVETDVEFVKHDLRKPFKVKASHGFCCDVMEHIHPKSVRKVIRNIMSAVDSCYFQICTTEDSFGEHVGEDLHLAVYPFWKWASILQDYGMIRFAREERGHAIFYVQRSLKLNEIDRNIHLHASDEQLKANVLSNLKEGYAEAVPHDKQDTEVAILAGGPSLQLFKDSGWKGPIITVNGAYNWAIENGFKPSAQIILDPREFNIRFTSPVIPDCKYLIASQCDPSIAKSLPKEQVWLWHSGGFTQEVIDGYVKETGKSHTWFPIFGGSTVVLRAFPLLIMLGLNKFHIYGFDSCLMDDKHHAYEQDENNENRLMDVIVGGRSFKCHPWMAIQAQEFIGMVKSMIGDHCQMEVYGDGLIAHILKTGAVLGETNGR